MRYLWYLISGYIRFLFQVYCYSFRRFVSIAHCSGKKVFAPFHNNLMNLFHPSEDYFELTEVIRQKGDSIFIDLLSNVRVGAVSEIDIALIASRSCVINNLSPPVAVIYLLSENSLKGNFNNERLMKLNYPLIEVPSLDKNPPGVCQLKLATVVNRSQSQTDGLAKLFGFKKSSRVILTINFSIDDRLVNGQLGTIVGTKQDSSDILNKMYVKFEDQNAGLTKMRSDRYASEHNIVPIVRIEANFRTQFSPMLAFAYTFHKSQGLALPSIVVIFSFNRWKKFRYGQLYEALTRVKSLENLYIEGQVTKQACSVDLDVESCKLETQCCLTT